MPTIIDGSASATFATPLPLSQGGTGNTSGNVVSSQVAGALNATGSAPLYACRAWVNFNGTGTVAIRASGNVSSITDRGVGRYTVNMATAMPDSNYATQASVRKNDGNEDNNFVVTLGAVGTTYSTTSVALTTGFTNQSNQDAELVCASIFR